MGILGTSLNYQNCIKRTNKIPEYAREYKREYQFIRGINKEFQEYLINKLDNLNNGLFESYIADRIKYFMKRFLKAQEKGKFKDISYLVLQTEDVDNLIFINEQFGYYKLRYDAFCDDDKPYPGFIEIYDIFKIFFNQIKYESCDSCDDDYDIIFSDSDSCDDDDYDIIFTDSVSDSDSDSYNDSDSDSDSDSDYFI